MVSQPTRESTSSSTRNLSSPPPRSVSGAGAVPSVSSTATGSVRTQPTNTLRSSLLIQCTKPSDETQTLNGSQSQSTNIANAVDSPQPAGRVVVLARDIFTSRLQVVPGRPPGNAGTCSVFEDTVRTPSASQTHSQTHPQVTHTLNSNPVLCQETKVAGNLAERSKAFCAVLTECFNEVLCAVLIVSATLISGLACALSVLLEILVKMAQFTRTIYTRLATPLNTLITHGTGLLTKADCRHKKHEELLVLISLF